MTVTVEHCCGLVAEGGAGESMLVQYCEHLEASLEVMVVAQRQRHELASEVGLLLDRVVEVAQRPCGRL